MTSQTGVQSILLGAVVVVSMVVGGVVTAFVTRGDSPAIVQTLEPMPSTVPVSATPATPTTPTTPTTPATPGASAGSIEPASSITKDVDSTAAPGRILSNTDLPRLVETVLPSVVKVESAFGSGRSVGVGSGLIVDKLGHVLTNFHVVHGADQVSVLLADGTRALAKISGTDSGNDLAVLRVRDRKSVV